MGDSIVSPDLVCSSSKFLGSSVSLSGFGFGLDFEIFRFLSDFSEDFVFSGWRFVFRFGSEFSPELSSLTSAVFLNNHE